MAIDKAKVNAAYQGRAGGNISWRRARRLVAMPGYRNAVDAA